MRKKYFVGNAVQKVFLAYSLVMGILSILLTRLQDYVFSVVGDGSILTAASVVVFVVFISYIIFGLLISNHIAGPLYRIQTTLLEYKEKGKAPKIFLRKGDMFFELAGLVNDLTQPKDEKQEPKQ